MNHIEIPTLLFWENGNSWYGSLGSARFFIQPETPEGEDRRLSVQFWRGPLSMELSEIIATAAFPVTEEGLTQVTAWLEERAAELEQGRPMSCSLRGVAFTDTAPKPGQRRPGA